jgi:hypothetical protein
VCKYVPKAKYKIKFYLSFHEQVPVGNVRTRRGQGCTPSTQLWLWLLWHGLQSFTVAQPFTVAIAQPFTVAIAQPFTVAIAQPFTVTITQPFTVTITQPFTIAITVAITWSGLQLQWQWWHLGPSECRV